MQPGKTRVLFICRHNSARSQMAEAFLRHTCGDRYEAYSAGTEPTEINPAVVEAMREIGIDISGQSAKGLGAFLDKEFDFVVTVCDDTRGICPIVPPGGTYIHKGFKDPETLVGTDDEKLTALRQLRDEIGDWVSGAFCSDRPNQE